MALHEIIIENLEIKAIIGVLEAEREAPQRVIIDMKVKYDSKRVKRGKAFGTKALTSTAPHLDKDLRPYLDKYLDYVELKDFLASHIKAQKYALLEDALEGSAKALKKRFPSIKRICLVIKKPDILQDCTISMRLKCKFIK
ncbi:hypothetical protein BKN38_06970 [Helicobacter sp. CLO-3]|uniref:dihydroneopterin aldolase n=1 Tax=unclassified Helicobacter TaxID=2593540 RepID=UPI000804EBDA|nr:MULTISPECIES: dihydroneopterin aldolase [unclassified Helicobacter]OBV28609.1 hypothetical protein BA723_01695 [Helicobacter sp. CLO-3]OHU82510.1 hypothetical protein BKN38_06970 [Helicobacter sp. CLO-3]